MPDVDPAVFFEHARLLMVFRRYFMATSRKILGSFDFQRSRSL